MYPLSWYQKCQDGSSESGSRGWGGDSACQKWYEHLSGEMLCKPTPKNIVVNTDSDKICEFTSDINLYHDKISQVITEILSLLQLIPSISSVILTIRSILSLSIQLAGDLSWLMNDINDVCNNYKCNPECVSPNICHGQYSEETLVNRNCLSSPNCNNTESGVCEHDWNKVANMVSQSSLSELRDNLTIKWSDLV